MMKILINLNEQDRLNYQVPNIETESKDLFFVPFPYEKMEDYHQKALIEALKLNLGIALDSKDYEVSFKEPYLFVIPQRRVN